MVLQAPGTDDAGAGAWNWPGVLCALLIMANISAYG
jgi:hypothetical protein